MYRSTTLSNRTGRAPRIRRWLHLLGPLVVLGIGVAALLGAVGLSLGELTSPGPGLWPFAVALLLTGSAAVLLAVDDPADYEPWTRDSARVLGGVACLGVFVVVFDAVGFLLPAFVLLLFWLRIFGRESWTWSVGLALTGSAGIWVLFDRVLGVPFPDDLVADLLGA